MYKVFDCWWILASIKLHMSKNDELLENWKDEILNSFYRVNGFRISNGPIEKANSEIRKLIKVSYGCSNFTRFRNRIMYIINKNEPILGVKKPNNNNRTFKLRGSYKK